MTKDVFKDAATSQELHPYKPADQADLLLLVVTSQGVSEHSLRTGEVVIGRSGDADVVVEQAGVSRRHAKLIISDTVMIEDCGSSNGTYVRGSMVAAGRPVPVSPGESIELGTAATLVLKGGRLSSAPPKRLLPHGYFEARVEEECVRGEATKRPFSVIRTATAEGQPAKALEAILGHVLRPADVVASYGPGEYEVLLPETKIDAMRMIAARIATAARDSGIEVSFAVASFPQDGRSAAALMSKAGGDEPQEVEAPERPPCPQNKGGMEAVYRLVRRIAATNLSVVVLGETGVGKGMLARHLHRLSPRAEAPFMSINCGALSETLLESEMFGHERGAFTGAAAAKKGLLEAADGGTVFLDEVVEMPPSLQVKLLHVLEDREVRPVGAVTSRSVDVRIVAATNRDLEAEVERRVFRRDLFFRLNGITITIPPLRERVTEIEELALLFAERAAKRLGCSKTEMHPEALQLLRKYWWPGNIRELKNVVERAVALCDGFITAEHLPVEKMGSPLAVSRTAACTEQAAPAALAPRPRPLSSAPPLPRPAAAETGAGYSRPTRAEPPDANEQEPLALWEKTVPEASEGALRQTLAAAERDRITRVLEECGGNQSAAARILGISRNTLAKRMDEYGIRRPRTRLG